MPLNMKLHDLVPAEKRLQDRAQRGALNVCWSGGGGKAALAWCAGRSVSVVMFWVCSEGGADRMRGVREERR